MSREQWCSQGPSVTGAPGWPLLYTGYRNPLQEIAMQIDGSCHCGSITYEAEIDPSQVEICHCTDCQTLSGSAYRVTVPVAAGQFKMSGTPSLYTKTAENGKKRFQAFCPNCGSPIYSCDAVETPAGYHI